MARCADRSSAIDAVPPRGGLVNITAPRAVERHLLEQWDSDLRLRDWEAFGAHCLQRLGTLGSAASRAQGEPLSAYENVRGTGNIHIWFDTLKASAT